MINREDRELNALCQKIQLAKETKEAKCRLCGKTFSMAAGEGIMNISDDGHGGKVIDHYCLACAGLESLEELKKERDTLNRVREGAVKSSNIYPGIYDTDMAAVAGKITTLDQKISLREAFTKPKLMHR